MFDSGKPIEMFVILFDDLLVVTRKKKALHKKVSIVIKNVHYPRGFAHKWPIMVNESE